MLDFRALATPLQIVDRGDLSIPDAVERQVTRSWAAALGNAPHLFDGPIFSVLSIEDNVLTVQRARYRHLIAVRNDRALAGLLQIRPLAVSGILSCPDGTVFGQRGERVTDSPRHWELVPSGGAEEANLQRQITRELEEEIGLASIDVSIAEPVALVIADDLVDIVVPISTALSGSLLIDRHRQCNGEYSQLLITPTPRQFAATRHDVVPTSRAIIEHLAARLP